MFGVFVPAKRIGIVGLVHSYYLTGPSRNARLPAACCGELHVAGPWRLTLRLKPPKILDVDKILRLAPA